MRRRFMTSTGGDYSRIIRYTSSDGEMVKLGISTIITFGAAIKTHTYTDDVGLIEFDALPTKVPSSAFSESSRLKTIVLPDSITNIDSGAFDRCTSLESIEFGNGEIYFGDRVLSYCTSLKKMIFHGLNPSIYDLGTSSFDNINSSGISVYYPTEDATYITKVIDHLDKAATADVNNFFPVTLVSGTTTVIGKELYDKYADRSNGSFTLDGSVTVDGIVYTSARMMMKQIYFGTYPLKSDGYLQGGAS